MCFLEPAKDKRRLFVAMPATWKNFKPCRALAVPTSPVFAHKANTMVDAKKDKAVSIAQIVYLWVLIADHVVMVIMQIV